MFENCLLDNGAFCAQAPQDLVIFARRNTMIVRCTVKGSVIVMFVVPERRFRYLEENESREQNKAVCGLFYLL